MINIIIGLAHGRIFDMFRVGGPYWAGFGNMILGAVCALFFWLLSLGSEDYELILTNKRIYSVVTKKVFFFRTMTNTTSYSLNKINNYSYYTVFTKKGICLYSTLKFSTSSGASQCIVDKDFYNNFVNAVNAASEK